MTTQPSVKLAPSILSADMARLGEQIAEADKAGGDYIHVDVMDGRFVPNLTIGPIVVEWARSWTKRPLDVHLMIVEPERLIPGFAKAGANILTVHAEACPHLHRVVGQIKELGVRAGVALNPGTPLSAIKEVLPELDLLLVMSVNPGFPAQKFIPGTLDKLKRARRLLDEGSYETELEVDGGVNATTVASVVEAGARVLVAGSAIFNVRQSVGEAMAHLREGFEAPVG